MPSLTIHHAATEIGGNAIEFSTDNTRVIFDLGMPLDSNQAKPKSLEINGLYPGSKPTVNAIVLSHPHQDHYGFIPMTHPDIPVYASHGTTRVLPILARFAGARHLIQRERFINFEAGKPFHIGDFSITAWEVDHSAHGACAFLIESCGRKAFYNGDLRAHGRKPWLWKKLIENVQNHKIDLMLLEGTSVGRNGRRFTEADVEKLSLAIMNKTKGPVLLQFSPANIDRLVSFVRATIQAGRTLVIDPYTASLLRTIAPSRSGGKRRLGTVGLPPWHSNRFRILPLDQMRKAPVTIREHPRISERLIEPAEFNKNPAMYFVLVRPGMTRSQDFASLNFESGTTIYSMWSGYRREAGQKEFEVWLREKGASRIEEVHSSGHILTQDSRDLLEKAAPKILVPIHTQDPAAFSDMYPAGQIRIMCNGETLLW